MISIYFPSYIGIRFFLNVTAICGDYLILIKLFMPCPCWNLNHFFEMGPHLSFNLVGTNFIKLCHLLKNHMETRSYLMPFIAVSKLSFNHKVRKSHLIWIKCSDFIVGIKVKKCAPIWKIWYNWGKIINGIWFKFCNLAFLN